MGKKKEEGPEASISRITRRASAPKAARKKSRLTEESVIEFAVPGLPMEVAPPEAAWSPVERIHLEELVVEEIQIEDSRPAESAVAASAPFLDPLADIPWLPPRAAALIRVAVARMNRGLLGRLVERGRPYGELLLGRARKLLARFGW